jgi:hypothetical protein
MLEVSSVNGGEGLQHPFLQPTSIIETFAVNTNLDLIYFVDTSDNTLKELSIINKQHKTLTPIPYAKGKRLCKRLCKRVKEAFSKVWNLWKNEEKTTFE